MLSIVKNAASGISSLDAKLGEIVYDFVLSDDISTLEIGENLVYAFENCSEEEFRIANDVLSAICGLGFKTLLDLIRFRDNISYEWQSLSD